MNSTQQIKTPELPEVPIQNWLSAEEVGAEFLVTGERVQAYRRQGFIDPIFIKEVGKKRYKFHPAVVCFLDNKFREAHFGGRALRSQPAGNATAGSLRGVCNA
jgi:hypothetical protein